MTSNRSGIGTPATVAALLGAALLVAIAAGCGPKNGATAEGGAPSGVASKAIPPPQPAYSKTGQRMQAPPPGFPGGGGGTALPPPGPAPR
jgi:hypothetical protein